MSRLIHSWRGHTLPRLNPPRSPPRRIVLGQSLPRLESATITADQLALCAAEDTELAGGASSQVGKKRAKTQEPKLWQLLTRNLLGFSPLLAREAVYRTTSDAESLLETSAAPWEELAWNVRELAALYDTHAWKPQLVERMGGDAC